MLCAAHKHAHSHAHRAQIFSSSDLQFYSYSITGQANEPDWPIIQTPVAPTCADTSELCPDQGYRELFGHDGVNAARFGRRPRGVSVGDTLHGEAPCERIAFYGALGG